MRAVGHKLRSPDGLCDLKSFTTSAQGWHFLKT